jgi:hypothetical protein
LQNSTAPISTSPHFCNASTHKLQHARHSLLGSAEASINFDYLSIHSHTFSIQS